MRPLVDVLKSQNKEDVDDHEKNANANLISWGIHQISVNILSNYNHCKSKLLYEIVL